MDLTDIGKVDFGGLVEHPMLGICNEQFRCFQYCPCKHVQNIIQLCG